MRAPIETARLSEFRTREHELAGVLARLKSLEELAAARAEYGDGARFVLSESPADVAQLGSVADYLDVEAGYERAVEAWLGDLLQHVVVPTHAHAAAGLRFARENNAGRVGFVIADGAGASETIAPVAGLLSVAQVARVSGTAAGALRGRSGAHVDR